MTSAKPTRTKQRHPRRPIHLKDLEVLDPTSDFRKEVEELRWYIAEHPRSVEEWTKADRDEFIRLAGNDSMLVGAALARPGLKTTATSENPHRVCACNDD